MVAAEVKLADRRRPLQNVRERSQLGIAEVDLFEVGKGEDLDAQPMRLRLRSEVVAAQIERSQISELADDAGHFAEEVRRDVQRSDPIPVGGSRARVSGDGSDQPVVWNTFKAEAKPFHLARVGLAVRVKEKLPSCVFVAFAERNLNMREENIALPLCFLSIKFLGKLRFSSFGCLSCHLSLQESSFPFFHADGCIQCLQWQELLLGRQVWDHKHSSLWHKTNPDFPAQY